MHFSILPKYRGASPIQSALLNGDSSSGISIIKMSENLDAGDIISSFNVKINPDDNKITLEKKLTDKCIEELPEILDLVKSNKIELIKQDGSGNIDIPEEYTELLHGVFQFPQDSEVDI